MNGEFARTAANPPESGQAASSAAPVSEFMIWNDMSVAPSSLRPSLPTGRPADTPARSDDD